MIYISKGYETKKLTPIKSELDDFETIVNSKVTTFEDVSSLDVIKRTQAFYFIAGELSEPIRNNESLLKRTLLVVDYDSLEVTEEEFESQLRNKIGVLTYYAYPSIRHGIAGTRYRLIIKTDRPFDKEENVQMLRFITDEIGLPYDESSETWSQAMGLKVTFESEEAYQGKCIYNEGRGVLKVDTALKRAEERFEKVKTKKPVFTVEYQRKKKFTASFMEELMDGVDEGNRDNWLTKQFGRMLSLGFNYVAAYEWLELINREFVRPPLADRELNRIVMSISEKDKMKFNKDREGD
ncbi:primase alpha helix C-terminal domain-containing protein [Alkalibacterium sp. MB6]|uniref:primase alpha helix C-terminal domain-containing protein n=1 Tax=Alkalibacterium sp. MB6 TaxID=2081965 RepID=UPI00137AB022|nr:primase alpha helix C-terminal domain-containing protein [Alkalibacterium sp. MB6]